MSSALTPWKRRCTTVVSGERGMARGRRWGDRRPGQVVAIRRTDRAGGSLRVARAARYLPGSCGCVDAAGGCRWCGFRQPGRVQYTDPAAKTHRSWTWWHNGQATGRPDRSRCSEVSPTSWSIPRRRVQRAGERHPRGLNVKRQASCPGDETRRWPRRRGCGLSGSRAGCRPAGWLGAGVRRCVRFPGRGGGRSRRGRQVRQ